MDSDSLALLGVFGIFGGFILIIFGLIIGLYILQSVVLKRIMVALELPNPNYAWIPIYNWYLVTNAVVPEEIGQMQWVIKLAPLSSFLNMIPIIGNAAAIVVAVVGHGDGIGYIEQAVFGIPMETNRIRNFVLGFFFPVWLIIMLLKG